VVSMAAVGVNLRAFTASCPLLCCFLQGPQKGQVLRIGLLVALGSAGECHGAEGVRVEVRRVWGVGGVLPIAVEGFGLRAFTVPCPPARLSFVRL